MKHRSLFGQLATQFSVSPENLATEALNHILSTSKTAKEAFAEYLNQLGPSIPKNLTLKTQSAGEDQSIPDLVGINSDGDTVLITESKF